MLKEFEKLEEFEVLKMFELSRELVEHSIKHFFLEHSRRRNVHCIAFRHLDVIIPQTSPHIHTHMSK